MPARSSGSPTGDVLYVGALPGTRKNNTGLSHEDAPLGMGRWCFGSWTLLGAQMNYGATWKGKKEPVDPCQFLDKFAEGSRITIGGPPRQLNPTYVACRRNEGIHVHYRYETGPGRFTPPTLVEEPLGTPMPGGAGWIRPADAASVRKAHDRVQETAPYYASKRTFMTEMKMLPTWVWVAVGAGAALFLTRRRK